MPDIYTSIQILQNTPVPNILVITGVVFIFLAIVGQFVGQITVHPGRQKWAGIVGVLFLLIGIGLYIVPEQGTESIVQSSNSNSSSAIQSIQIYEGETKNIFDNDLSIALNRFDCGIGEQIDITIGSPSVQNIKINNPELGDTNYYMGKDPYEIRFMKKGVFCNWIQLQITKLEQMPEPSPTSIIEPNVVTVAVRENKSEVIFDGDLVITVENATGTFVSAVIGSPNYPNTTVSFAKVGDVITYEGKDTYSIRIMEISSIDVDLRITKLTTNTVKPVSSPTQ